MGNRVVRILSAAGIHARPAGKFAEAAAMCGRKVTIGKVGGPQVAADSILSVMGLGTQQGDTVEIRVAGEGTTEIMDELEQILVSEDH